VFCIRGGGLVLGGRDYWMIPSTGYSTPLLETLISFIFGAFKIGCSWNFLAGFPAKWPWCRSVWWPQKEVAMATVRWERDAGVLAEHLGCSSILVAMNLVLCYTCANMFTSFFLQGIWGGPWMWISMISHDGGYQLQSTIWPLRPSKESCNGTKIAQLVYDSSDYA